MADVDAVVDAFVDAADDADVDADADDADVGVVCSVRNASILIECTGSAKWGGNSEEEENDAIMINTTIFLWVLKNRHYDHHHILMTKKGLARILKEVVEGCPAYWLTHHLSEL